MAKNSKPLLTPKEFMIKQIKFASIAGLLILFSLIIGMVGYHYLADIPWVDSLLNASMILTGMGPVDKMDGNAAKIFASIYALYSGIAFLSTSAILLTPGVHRIMHIIHLDDE